MSGSAFKGRYAVVRLGVCIVILLALCAAMARPDDKARPKEADPEKVKPVTKEKLLGKWKGEFKDGTVEVEFKDELAVVTLEFSGGNFAVGSVGYEVDVKANTVKVDKAVAKPSKDEALLLSGQFVLGTATYTVPETRLKHDKRKEPKK